MPCSKRRNPLAAATGLALLCLVLAVSASPASAQLSTDEAGKKLAETYNVRVLDVRLAQHDGRAVYAAKVMRTVEGAGNGAFMVTTLLVDPMTGDLVSTFEHGTTGYSTSATDSHEPRLDSSGREMRRMTNRPTPRN